MSTRSLGGGEPPLKPLLVALELASRLASACETQGGWQVECREFAQRAMATQFQFHDADSSCIQISSRAARERHLVEVYYGGELGELTRAQQFATIQCHCSAPRRSSGGRESGAPTEDGREGRKQPSSSRARSNSPHNLVRRPGNISTRRVIRRRAYPAAAEPFRSFDHFDDARRTRESERAAKDRRREEPTTGGVQRSLCLTEECQRCQHGGVVDCARRAALRAPPLELPAGNRGF